MTKKRADSRKNMTVTTVAFDNELHRRLALAALDEGAAITELVRQAVTEWLDARDKRPRRRIK
jgi:predicted HicB family RNase H-like nuclease